MRKFEELTLDEQSLAMEKLYNTVLDELLNGKKTPLFDPYASRYSMLRSAHGWGLQDRLKVKLANDPIMDEWIAEIAGQLAAAALYIPDDGSMVVRL